MNVEYKTSDGTMTFHFDVKNVKELLKALTDVQEVFAQNTRCGACQSDRTIARHREAKGFDFYERVCLDCRAHLALGQTKEGDHLFPKRKDDQGNWLPNGGWTLFSQGDGTTPTAPARGRIRGKA